MDPAAAMMESHQGGHITQLEVLEAQWGVGSSPQRDDLKLLCEQNVRTSAAHARYHDREHLNPQQLRVKNIDARFPQTDFSWLGTAEPDDNLHYSTNVAHRKQ